MVRQDMTEKYKAGRNFLSLTSYTDSLTKGILKKIRETPCTCGYDAISRKHLVKLLNEGANKLGVNFIE